MKSGSERPERRPGSVLGAGIPLVVIGALGALLGWYQLSQLGVHGERVDTWRIVLAWAALIILSGAQVASGLYVLIGRSWAWLLGLVFSGLYLFVGVIPLLVGNVAAVTGIAISIALIVMLDRDDVRRWCGAGPPAHGWRTAP